MKKIFTLFAVAAMAMSAHAVNYFAVGNEVTAPAFEVTTVDGITAVIGGEKSVNKNGIEIDPTKPDPNKPNVVWANAIWNKIGDFKLTIDGVSFPKMEIAGDNARNSVNSSPSDGNPACVYGGFVKFVPSKDGAIKAAAEMSNGKTLVVMEIKNGEEEGTNLFLTGGAKFYDGSGTEVAVNADGQIADKTKGYAEWSVKAGDTYYFTVAGSKLSFAGFIFTPDTSTAITDINVDNANAPVEYFNLQGIRVENPQNGLYIRRQGNKVEKVYVK